MPSQAGVARWRVASDDGTPAELLLLRTRDPTAEAHFRDVHQRLSQVHAAGVLRTIEVLEVDNRPIAVRPPLEDATLAGVQGALEPAIVAAIGRDMVSAVQSAGPVTAGGLHPRDIGIDSAGRPVLAPLGAMPDASRIWAAPEGFRRGIQATGAAGLYGLGSVLWKLATGRNPPQGNPPPSTVQAGIPAQLDTAITTLWSADPSDRSYAGAALDEVATRESIDLRPTAARGSPRPATIETGTVAYTTGQDREAAPHGVVVLPNDKLQALTPAQKSAAAGWASLSLNALDEIAAAGLPLVVEGHRSLQAAQERVTEMRTATGLELEVVRPPGTSTRFMVGAGTMGNLLALVFVGAISVIAATLVGPVALAGLAVAGVLAVVLQLQLLGTLGGQTAQNAMTAWERGQAARRVERADPLLGTAWERLNGLRRQLSLVGLPETAELDVREALRDVERELVGLGRVAATARSALAAQDLDQLRTKMKVLERKAARDPSAASQRDQLARIVSDMEAIQTRLAGIRQDVARIDTSLDEVAAVLGTLAAHEVATSADRLADTTRLVREAVAESHHDEPNAAARAAREREL